MCKYCDEDIKRTNIDDNGEIKIYIDKQMGNNLCIEYYHYGAKTNRYIPIVFCPMCGRLVNKDVLRAIQKSINTPKMGMQVEMPTMPEINAPVINDFSQEIAKAITEAVNPINIANNISKNIMSGGMQ